MKLLAHCLVLCGLAFSHAASAADNENVSIEWVNPDEYRDIRPANQSKSSFRDSVFANIQKFVEIRLMPNLPEGYHLTLTVTDVDLAGEVWPSMMVGLKGSSDIRLIKDIDSPRIAFSYRLKNQDGEVIAEGEEDIRDMGFMQGSTGLSRSDTLKYEKKLLRDWFYTAFEEFIVK